MVNRARLLSRLWEPVQSAPGIIAYVFPLDLYTQNYYQDLHDLIEHQNKGKAIACAVRILHSQNICSFLFLILPGHRKIHAKFYKHKSVKYVSGIHSEAFLRLPLVVWLSYTEKGRTSGSYK